MAKTLQRMNKEITLLGLAPMQFILLLLLQIGFYAISWKILLLTIPLSIVLGNYIAKNNKKGNPDYLSSIQNKYIAINSIEDNAHVMKYLIKDKKNKD